MNDVAPLFTSKVTDELKQHPSSNNHKNSFSHNADKLIPLFINIRWIVKVSEVCSGNNTYCFNLSTLFVGMPLAPLANGSSVNSFEHKTLFDERTVVAEFENLLHLIDTKSCNRKDKTASCEASKSDGVSRRMIEYSFIHPNCSKRSVLMTTKTTLDGRHQDDILHVKRSRGVTTNDAVDVLLARVMNAATFDVHDLRRLYVVTSSMI